MNPLGGDNTAFIDQVTLSANAINDGSFETPALAAGTYQFAPSRFALAVLGDGRRGQQRQHFTSGNPNAPDGTQVAFIKGNGSMSQSVDLVAGSYNLSFLAAQRANGRPRTSKSRCWSTARASRLDHALSTTYQSLRDVELHGCGRNRTPSSSLA